MSLLVWIRRVLNGLSECFVVYMRDALLLAFEIFYFVSFERAHDSVRLITKFVSMLDYTRPFVI